MSWFMHTWYLFVAGAAVIASVVFWKWHDIHQRVGIWGYAGTALGWILVALGVMGWLLPIIPGFPLWILGLLLLGPNDPLVRRLWLKFHHIARRSAHSRFARVRRFGHWLLEHELRVAQRVYKEGHIPPWAEEALMEKRSSRQKIAISGEGQSGGVEPPEAC